jgi:hypothetical protein
MDPMGVLRSVYRPKTSRLTTNATLICGLSFRAESGTKMGRLGMCRFNGRFLMAPTGSC